MLKHEPKVVSLNPSGITVLPDRMRRLRPEVVNSLAESIKDHGGQVLHPIVVRPKPKKALGYFLIAGWHRLMATRQLKLESIRASVLDGLDADQAELLEIDENLMRADLSPAERAMHIDKRKMLYEKLHPETKHGGTGRGRNRDANLASLIDKTAKQTGQSKRKVAREATRGKKGQQWLGKVAGTVLDKGDEIDALIKLPAKERNALIKRAVDGERVSAKTELKKVKREQREKELGAKQQTMPTKEYGLIVTDDAWNTKVWSRETGMDRHAANHYPVEDAYTAEEMHAATKDRFGCAAKDCVLAMWATSPHSAIAHKLMELRGFTYKSQVVWYKKRIGKGRGTGYWFINEHEVMLIGTRGSIPAPAPGTQWSSVIEAPVGKHSAKPEIFLQMLEEYFPNLPKIEFNRRGKPRNGWSAWGNEVELPEAAE